MKTILVADDDVVTRKVLKTMGQKLGYKVIESEDGEAALKILKRRKVEILVSDWLMPEVDGLELCEKLRGKTGKKAPFIFLITGKKKGLRNYAEALAAGADDFLYKPVDFFVFSNQIRAAEEKLGLAA